VSLSLAKKYYIDYLGADQKRAEYVEGDEVGDGKPGAARLIWNVRVL